MNTIKQQIIETEKGCLRDGNVLGELELCGNNNWLCPVCKSKLSTLKSCEKFVEEAKIEEIDFLTDYITMLNTSSKSVIIECIKRRIASLKQQIGGQNE